jgi:hypothetical protein
VKEVSDTTVLVYGHGLELPVAERLSRDCKRVLHFSEWQEGFSTINKAIIGDGIEGVERCHDIWDVLDDVDVWVFPDIGHSGLQLHLESLGKPVWGSRRADQLETDREYFLETLESLGLDVPKFEVVVGITALRKSLKSKEDYYIKISKYRGSLETKHWRSWDLDENLLDLWAVRFGAAREMIPFLVFAAINTPLEIGGDTYNVRGQWPSLMLNGVEWKDQAYFACVTNREEMPEQVQVVNDAFSPLLKQYRYANEWSTEIRVLGDKFFFIDPTTRLGLPSTGSQLELWSNFSEIVCAGANGELIDPEPLGQYSAEIILSTKGNENLWTTIEIPKELKQWVKLADCCEVDGVRSFPREGGDDEHVGWLVSIGDTPHETIDRMKENISLLPQGLSADISPLADILKEIETAEDKGITFSEEPLPEPETVLSDE